MPSGPFARSISIDYSDDELDALAEAFTRRDLARRERGGDGRDAIRRAQNETALRGLVARRAIALAGSAARPLLTFLEPHATLLGAFLGAEAVATIRREERTSIRAVSLFVHDAVVVEQAARDGLAVQRMTAHDRDAADELLRREVALNDVISVAEPAAALELTSRMMTLTIEAIERGDEPPACVPCRAVDLLWARRASGSVAISARDAAGVHSAGKWSWIDGGELGLWRVHADDESPILRLVRVQPGELADEVGRAWSLATGV